MHGHIGGHALQQDAGAVIHELVACVYRDSAALFDVTFEGEEDDPVSLTAMEDLKEALADYDISISSSVGESQSETPAAEMQVIMGIAAVIVVLVLLISKTYGEIPVLLTFLAAMLLNMGTNFIFGEISFVSNSISSILQLALAIDYAIILCHRFSEGRQQTPAREACILALSKAIPEISSSCLTTLAGLAAMMFMEFRIGFDMGMVLIKSILFSILSVFTLMPGLLMLFSKLIDRTHPRSFVPKITVWGRFITKLKYIVPPMFACVLVAAFFLPNQCPYGYGESMIKTDKQSDSKVQQEAIEARFGTQNVMAVIVPAGDYATGGTAAGRVGRPGGGGHRHRSCQCGNRGRGLRAHRPVDAPQFSQLVDVDIEVVRLLYTAYAADLEEYGRIVNNIDNYSVSILDMFLFLYDRVDEGCVTLDDEDQADLEDMHDQITDVLDQLQGTEISRLVLNRDNVLISVLSILFVIIVLLFTFQSVALPILLILVIQDSIWINFAVPTIRGTYIFFMSYLVVSSIQMGANIDYAIVISSRYQELKRTGGYD